MKNCLWLGFVCLFVLSGCGKEGQRTSVEDLAMVSSIAFDYIDDEKMRMTVTVPHPVGENEEVTQLYTVETHLIQEGLVKISSESDKMVILNQLRTLLFGEKFAREGKIAEAVEHFYRNAQVGNNVRLGVVKGRADELLKGQYPEQPETDRYLNDLLQPKRHTSYSPFTTIHTFQYSESNPIFFSMMSYLEKREESIDVIGLALFDHGKMKEAVTRKEGAIIQALKGEDQLAPLTLTLKEEPAERVHIELIKNKARIKSNRNINAPKLKIELKLQGALYEYKGDKDLSKPEQYHALEKEVSAKMKKDVMDLLAKLKELEVDPIGFSDHFRMYYQGEWKEDLTKEVLEKATYEVTVDFKLLNTGTIE